ncbi:MAG: hypothetical protein ACYDC6_06120 [Acidobacteriaceae bacterium]
MKIFFFVVLAFFGAFARGQNPELVPAVKSACGPANMKFDVKLDNRQHPMLHPVNGKAIIYIIQEVPDQGILMKITTTTRIGLDGRWVGANRRSSYFGFIVDPGVHHLCVRGQWNRLTSSNLIALHHIVTKAGGVYYFRIRFLYPLYVPGNFFLGLEPADEDEAQFLIQTSAHSTSHPK